MLAVGACSDCNSSLSASTRPETFNVMLRGCSCDFHQHFGGLLVLEQAGDIGQLSHIFNDIKHLHLQYNIRIADRLKI